MHISCVIKPDAKVLEQIEKETSPLFTDHPEFLWYAPEEYLIELISWPHVDEDLITPLHQKVSELVFNISPFTLFGLEYVIRIGTRIDINLDFQTAKIYRDTVETLHTFFNPKSKPNTTPYIALARYKIPSKQQYSHVKNQLAKMNVEVELPVKQFNLVKVTDFGHGIRTYEKLVDIPLIF